MKTIGSVQDKNAGYGAGFDFLRIALALLVMAFHTSATLGNGPAWMEQPFWIVKYSLLPMFFAVSGFLISGSALRLPFVQFALNRGARIVPALTVVVVLSAVVIGPLFTSLPVGEYFSHPDFRHYFTNIIGLINFHLPGLFYERGQPGIVNAALWTIPYEIMCYTACFILLQLPRRHYIIMAAVVFFAVVPHFINREAFNNPASNWLLFGRGTFLFPCFLTACLFYVMRYRIPFHAGLFAAALVILAAASVLVDPAFVELHNLSLVVCFCIVYVMAYIGLSKIPKLPIISSGDYSYGVYVCHCPLINCVYYFVPTDSWLVLFTLSLVPVSLFAVFSWHFIEKPILKMRKKFSFVGKRIAH